MSAHKDRVTKWSKGRAQDPDRYRREVVRVQIPTGLCKMGRRETIGILPGEGSLSTDVHAGT